MEISGGSHNLIPFTNHSLVEMHHMRDRMNYNEYGRPLIDLKIPYASEVFYTISASLLPYTYLAQSPSADCRYVQSSMSRDENATNVSLTYPSIDLKSGKMYSLGFYVLSLADSISIKISDDSEGHPDQLNESVTIEASTFSYEDPEHINMVWNRVETSFVCDHDSKFSISISTPTKLLFIGCIKLEEGASCTSWSDHILATGVALSQMSNYNQRPLILGNSSTTPNRDGMYVSGEHVPNIEFYIVHDSNLYRGDPTDGQYGAHLHVEGEFDSTSTSFRIHGVGQFGVQTYRDTIGFMYDHNNVTSDPVSAYVVKVRFESETVEADPTEEYTVTTSYVEITPPDVQYASDNRLKFSVDIPILLVNDQQVSNPSYQPESNN